MPMHCIASCELCLALCPAALQPPSYMHLSQVGWTTVARSWRACLWLKLPVLIGFCYKIAVLVWRVLLGSAPGYLCELCRPVPGLPGRRALRSSATGQLLCLVLKLQLRIVAHSPLLAPPPGMDSPWKSVSCLKIMKVRFAGCLRLICIAVAGLGAPLSRFLEGAPYKFLHE